MKNNLAPIVLFCYNRLDCLKKTIDALQNNELAQDSELIIYSDGPKAGADSAAIFGVQAYLKTITGFKSIQIHESETNRGLANSVIAGVTEVVNKYGKIIVLEDDLVTSPFFLKWMNRALELYYFADEIGAVTGFSPLNSAPILPDSFLLIHTHCWGWGTWRRAWNLFNPDAQFLLNYFSGKEEIKHFNLENSYFFYDMLKMQRSGKVDSWFIRWNASLFFAGKYTLYPKHNLVSNIGINSGTHYSESSEVKVIPLGSAEPLFATTIPIEENKEAYNLFRQYYRSLWNSTCLDKVLIFLKRILYFVLPYGIIKLYFRFFKNTNTMIQKTIRKNIH